MIYLKDNYIYIQKELNLAIYINFQFICPKRNNKTFVLQRNLNF